MFSRRAWASSSLPVGSSPRRPAAASLPSAVCVRLGRFFSVCFWRAPCWACLTLRRAAARCLVVAMPFGYPSSLHLHVVVEVGLADVRVDDGAQGQLESDRPLGPGEVVVLELADEVVVALWVRPRDDLALVQIGVAHLRVHAVAVLVVRGDADRPMLAR